MHLKMSGSASDIAQATLQAQQIVNALVLDILVANGLADRDQLVSFLEEQTDRHDEATGGILTLLAMTLRAHGEQLEG
ncbi:hypothetical protein [Brevundimonas sp.]|uniref:hypothetical protein n=1 Tax=Brevundimonas sp. TaxID=1871086 RepID=UPI0025C57DB3|nr:hypothetical protein [Brevundimonas sp.]